VSDGRYGRCDLRTGRWAFGCGTWQAAYVNTWGSTRHGPVIIIIGCDAIGSAEFAQIAWIDTKSQRAVGLRGAKMLGGGRWVIRGRAAGLCQTRNVAHTHTHTHTHKIPTDRPLSPLSNFLIWGKLYSRTMSWPATIPANPKLLRFEAVLNRFAHLIRVANLITWPLLWAIDNRRLGLQDMLQQSVLKTTHVWCARAVNKRYSCHTERNCGYILYRLANMAFWYAKMV